MSLFEILMIGVGLSMDAFAVSLSKGICLKEMRWRYALSCGIWFGLFQALMPSIGYFAGSRFHDQIERYDHWIAFALLALIGVNMIRESFGKEEPKDDGFGFLQMLLLAVATSIDALAVGLSFAALSTPLFPAVLLIGCTTFLFGFFGVWFGHLSGTRFRSRAEILGGLILIVIGIRILLSHLLAA